VILAGGRSRRMGRDKAGLNWRGQSWLDRARAVLKEAGAGRILVLGRPDLADGIADPAPGSGPAVNLAGLIAGLPAGTRLIVVPVDMPTLDPAVLQSLAACGSGGVPRGAVLPAALTVPLGSPVPRGEALRDLWAALGLPEIELPPGRSLFNVNTPAELDALAADIAPWT
jgi:molybdopterin-guanine dinucleotide biosynthesis protein A